LPLAKKGQAHRRHNRGSGFLAAVMEHPGFGGQTFIPYMLRKIRQVQQLLSERNLACEIEIDGGVEVETIGAAYEAGARVFVASTSVFRHPAGPAAGVLALIDTVTA
jgi:ribulose-phosphate 3-epimerase